MRHTYRDKDGKEHETSGPQSELYLYEQVLEVADAEGKEDLKADKFPRFMGWADDTEEGVRRWKRWPTAVHFWAL